MILLIPVSCTKFYNGGKGYFPLLNMKSKYAMFVVSCCISHFVGHVILFPDLLQMILHPVTEEKFQ